MIFIGILIGFFIGVLCNSIIHNCDSRRAKELVDEYTKTATTADELKVADKMCDFLNTQF